MDNNPKDKSTKSISRSKSGEPEGNSRAGSIKPPPVDEPMAINPKMLVGTVLDNRYRIDALLGEGGMGEVYSAEHVQIGRKLAIKVLHPLYSNEEEVLERFRREARAATAIGHPNIVDVTDSGTTPDGRAFFVMEVLEGMELADVIIDNGWMDPERAAHVAIQVCQAVGAAHKVGIIHRDLKPENVFLVTRDGEPDFVKILDFGIAKSTRMEMTRGGGLTQPGLAMGTPEYMAPEQAAGQPADSRVDVYATGGLLYAMIVGRPPHEGDNIMEVLTLKATKTPESPKSIRPEIPEELDAIVMKALSRNPDMRHQTMEQLEYDLRKFMSGRGAAVAAILGLRDSDSALIDISFLRSSGSNPEIPVLEKQASGKEDVFAEEKNREAVSENQEGEQLEGVEAPEPVDSLRVRAFTKPVISTDDDTPISFDEIFKEKSRNDFDGFSQHTHTVVRKPGKGLGWLWALLGFVVLAAVTTGFFLLRKRQETKRERDAIAKRGEHQDASFEDHQDAEILGVDSETLDADSDKADAEPLVPRLTNAEVTFFLEMAWKAAKKQRWTRPEKESLLSFIGRLEEAGEAQKEIEKLRRYARKELYKKGRRFLVRKKYDKAEVPFRDLLALVPGDGDAKENLVKVLVARAHKALEQKKHAQAEALAGEAMSLDSTNPSARYGWARALEAEGKKKRALAEYEKLLKDKKSARFLRRRSREAVRRLKKELKKEQEKE